MNKNNKGLGSSTAPVVGVAGTEGGIDGSHTNAVEFDPLKNLRELANLTSVALLDEVKRYGAIETTLWFRRAAALGALSDREGFDQLNKRQHGRRLAEIAKETGVSRTTLGADLRIYRAIFRDHMDELESLARERFEREVYITASSAPDAWGALQTARERRFKRQEFKEFVRGLKGELPREARNGRAREFETELRELRPHFTGRSDREILLLALSALKQGLEVHQGSKKGRVSAARRVARRTASSPAEGGPVTTLAAVDGKTRTSAPEPPTPNRRNPSPAHE